MQSHSIRCRNSNINGIWCADLHVDSLSIIKYIFMEHLLSSHCSRCGYETRQQKIDISPAFIESYPTSHCYHLSPIYFLFTSDLSDILQLLSCLYSAHTVATQMHITHTHTHSFSDHEPLHISGKNINYSDDVINLNVLVRNILIGDLGSFPF